MRDVQPSAAIADFTHALALAERAGQIELVARIKGELGHCLLDCGAQQQAFSLLTEAMLSLRQIFSELGAKKNRGYLLVPWRRAIRDSFRTAQAVTVDE
jgi:hypothetical protein